ncbi:MAG TPA: translation initiation factor IF-2 [Candidatus Paceibacterota bacterium]|nr:translation initiation factor IF-2 [Candidatus Paceibacterota bacterium]
MTKQNKAEESIKTRPPVVAIVGHIDHGKTTLLDYIRKSNVAGGESGGITQHLSAFVVKHKDDKNIEKEIVFIDTPGHSAFTGMRERGLKVADIAILVVSGEEGVKEQTKEAIKQIEESKTPFIVAITKSDKPNSNVEKVKIDLAEQNVLVEGFGGNIPFIAVSGKTGDGIDQLLEIILLVAEMENFTADVNKNAVGVVIESHRDTKRGISATLVIKNGTLKKGDFVALKGSLSGTRIMEDFMGKNADTVPPSHPVQIVGWDNVPSAGEFFETFDNKKDAEVFSTTSVQKINLNENIKADTFFVPIIIKADTLGTLEAIIKEIRKIEDDKVSFKIISSGVGQVTEADVKSLMTDKDAVIVSFRVKTEKGAQDLAIVQNIQINSFDIIYKLVEFLEELKEIRRPRELVLEEKGKTKVLRIFNKSKEKQVVGGRVTEGALTTGRAKIIRRENIIGEATILGIEQAKTKAREVLEGNECGIMIASKIEIAIGDVILSFVEVEK